MADFYTWEQVVELHDMLASGRVGFWWIAELKHVANAQGVGYVVTLFLGPRVSEMILSEWQPVDQVARLLDEKTPPSK